MRSSASASPPPRPRRKRSGCRSTAMSAGSRPTLLPVPMMNILNGGAHADNPHRLPGIHGHAGRRADLFRSAALRRRDLPRAEERAPRRRACRPPSATRAASRRTSPRPARRSISSCEAIESAGYSPATTCCSRSTARRPNSSRTAATRWTARADADARRDGRLSRPSLPPIIRSPRSRTAWPRTTWTAGSC